MDCSECFKATQQGVEITTHKSLKQKLTLFRMSREVNNRRAVAEDALDQRWLTAFAHVMLVEHAGGLR